MLKKTIAAVFFCCFLWGLPAAVHAQVIHEVRTGDTLDRISKQYGLQRAALARLNGLAPNTGLVPGQAILLPGSTYIVQPGDSLWAIAKRHSVSEPALRASNGLRSSVLRHGQKLKIPHPPKTLIWTGSYLVPKERAYNEWVLGRYRNTLSAAFVFEYPANYDAGVAAPYEFSEANKLAWKNGLPPYATVTNISSKGFDPALAHHLIADAARRKRFIDNVYKLLDAGDYKGVVIDFEQVWPKDRAYLNGFMRQLAARLHPRGMEVVMAVPPLEADRVPSYSAAYDYKTLGRLVDKLFLMTYDWHWPGGPSGPIAPITHVRQTVVYAGSVVPKHKIMLGIPQYAYDWTMKDGKQTGKAYSVQRAIDLYTGYQSEIRFDEQAASPSFRYVDASGARHEVWFEDPRSLIAKLRLVKEFGLYGIGAWHLGLTIPQTEAIVNDMFRVKNAKDPR